MNIEAPTAVKFCNITADAHRYKLNGNWAGSAYRYHPRGIIRDGLIFTNGWSTFNYCSVKVMLDPTSPIKPIFNHSTYNGDPNAYPERGGTLTVYDTGRWSADDGPWRAKIVAILADLEAEIAAAKAIETERKQAEQEQRQQQHNEKVEAAKRAMQ